jgi:hypothetical protein
VSVGDEDPVDESKRRALRAALLLGGGTAAALALTGSVRAPPSDRHVVADEYDLLKGLTSDPAPATDGMLAWRTDLRRLRRYSDGDGWKSLAHADELTVHTHPESAIVFDPAGHEHAGLTSGNLIPTGGLENNAVTYAKMQDVSATDRFLGRKSVGVGDPEELTGTEATARLDVFTPTLKGLVPASGGGTANFLRADGNFAAPPVGGGGGALALSDRVTTADFNVTTNRSAYIAGEFEIGSGFVLELEADAVLEIG